MPELIGAFRFRVRLVRAGLPGPTGTPPPNLKGGSGNVSAARSTPRGEGSRVRGPSTSVAPRPGATEPPPPNDLGDGGFAECGGLDIEADIRDLTEGGRNDAVVRRVGRVKPAQIVLKRGMLIPNPDGYADVALWSWLFDMVAGTLLVPRYDGHVEVLDPRGVRVVAHWSFARGLPAKVVGPALNAQTGAVALEELHIAHEGLRLEVAP